MSFACTMRIGEIAGLQWKHIDLENDKLYVRQILQRIAKESLRKLKPKIFLIFPDKITNSKSTLVLKEPKTTSSIRKLPIPLALKEAVRNRALARDELRLYLVRHNPNYDPTEIKTLFVNCKGGNVAYEYKDRRTREAEVFMQ